MKIKKFLAKLFIIVSTFIVVLSPLVSIAESHHHCDHHDDCPICEVIRTTKETIKQTEVTPPTASMVFIIPFAFIFVSCIAFILKNIDFTSLVKLKTKLSN